MIRRRLGDPRRLPRPNVSGRILAALLAIAGCAWAFLAIAEEVFEGETRGFDAALLMAFRNPADPSDPIGPGWLEEFGRDLTALGGVGVLGILTLAAAGYLELRGERRSMWFLLVCVFGGMALSTLFKRGFERPRPDLVPHEVAVYTASFPSGHSMLAAVVYLTLAVMIARVEPRRALKVYVFALAALLTVAIGVSRLYLGVHWPTDVLAGWTAGAAWALMCYLAARWLQFRGAIEPEREAPAA